MESKHLVTLGLSILSVLFFIPASIILPPDPIIMVFASLISIGLVFSAFILNLKKGSFIVGFIMAPIGGFYVVNGYNLFRLATDPLSSYYSASSATHGILTVVLGAVMLALGLLSIVIKLNKFESRSVTPNSN